MVVIAEFHVYSFDHIRCNMVLSLLFRFHLKIFYTKQKLLMKNKLYEDRQEMNIIALFG